jgi:hypothetical protein
MTNEDATTDVRISNWTLATGTKPGARDVYLPLRDAARRTARERTLDASRNGSLDADDTDSDNSPNAPPDPLFAACA